MNIDLLVSKLAELKAYIDEGAATRKSRPSMSARQERILQDLMYEVAQTVHSLLPPGETCACCEGTGKVKR